MKILVVDDSAMMRKIIRRELEQGDFDVYEAADGLEALKSVEEVQPDLITLDVDMPRMNGFETCTKIRTEPLNNVDNRIPIVFITANDTLEGRTRGFEAGASDFITKPFLEGEVLATVQHLLARDKGFSGLTAVIAEDNNTARYLLNNILKSEGINTLLASNGREAFDMIKHRMDEVDLLLTDYIMPEMNGDELCRKIRKDLGYKSLPIIFLSAMSERGSILDIFKSGASDYVIKPFAKEELLSRIRVHLESQLMNRRLEWQVRELKRLSKLKDDFLAITSHDLRAPLNGILGFTQLLQEDENLTETQKEYLSHVLESGNFLLDLIGDILYLGQAQSEQEQVTMTPINVKELIQSSTNTGSVKFYV